MNASSASQPKHSHRGGRTRRLSKSGTGLYALLNVEKTSSPDEIKKAYRRLALKYHPDKNRDDPEAAEKFKEINYANSVLMDEKKRQIYDAYGSIGLHTAETLGDKNLSAFLLSKNKCFRALVLCFGLLTCGFYCCCCYCFCCYFCCGKCAPEEEIDVTVNLEEDLQDDNTTGFRFVDSDNVPPSNGMCDSLGDDHQKQDYSNPANSPTRTNCSNSVNPNSQSSSDLNEKPRGESARLGVGPSTGPSFYGSTVINEIP